MKDEIDLFLKQEMIDKIILAYTNQETVTKKDRILYFLKPLLYALIIALFIFSLLAIAHALNEKKALKQNHQKGSIIIGEDPSNPRIV